MSAELLSRLAERVGAWKTAAANNRMEQERAAQPMVAFIHGVRAGIYEAVVADAEMAIRTAAEVDRQAALAEAEAQRAGGAPKLTAEEIDRLLAAARLLQAHGQRWADFARDNRGLGSVEGILADMVAKGLLRAGESIGRSIGLAGLAAGEIGGDK